MSNLANKLKLFFGIVLLGTVIFCNGTSWADIRVGNVGDVGNMGNVNQVNRDNTNIYIDPNSSNFSNNSGFMYVNPNTNTYSTTLNTFPAVSPTFDNSRAVRNDNGIGR